MTEAFLVTFEQVVTAAQQPATHQAISLAPYFMGPSQAACRGLDPVATQDYFVLGFVCNIQISASLLQRNVSTGGPAPGGSPEVKGPLLALTTAQERWQSQS